MTSCGPSASISRRWKNNVRKKRAGGCPTHPVPNAFWARRGVCQPELDRVIAPLPVGGPGQTFRG